ncbi:MAG: hypothetical protein EZS28_003302 [Streblomastix strix]|uniref:Uncharacterized protein n=1 Tax=Streblomastix strix TaxID=222440 RepID=A0A5J4X3F5_9EUKA|nr:MAG: hypothetical protein EZS28_003302 [Streblomastix strix]
MAAAATKTARSGGNTTNHQTTTHRIHEQPPQPQPSALTNTMVEILLSDMDASKVMTDELGNIVPLQLNPYIVSQYKFTNTISRRRLVKYTSDLAPQEQTSMTKSLYQNQDIGSNGQALNDKMRLEPILSTDQQLRQQIRRKVKKELGVNGSNQPYDDGLNDDDDVEQPQTPDLGASGDMKGAEGGGDKIGGGRAKGICQIAAQQQINSGNLLGMGMKPQTRSPFAEVFSDPDRQSKRGEFSPFSSKTVPQMDAQANAQQKKGNKRVEQAKELGIPLDQDEEEEEDGEDLNFEDFSAKQDNVDIGFNGKKKKKNKRADRSIVEAMEKKVEERHEKNVSSSVVLGGGGGTGLGAAKEKKNKKQSKILPPNARSLGEKNINLYKSPIRKQMEGVLMGTIFEGQEVFDEDQEEEEGTGSVSGGEQQNITPTERTVALRQSVAAQSQTAQSIGGQSIGGQSGIQTYGASYTTRSDGNNLPSLATRRSGHSRIPMMVTKKLEPNNERALDDIVNEKEVEDASLQKYVHLGIASPSYSVTQFQKFMVKTQQETDSSEKGEINKSMRG